MTEISLQSARETIALFDRQIAEAEAQTRSRVERLRSEGYEYDDPAITKEWDECGLRLRLVREAREKLVSAVATIVGMVPTPAIIKSAT